MVLQRLECKNKWFRQAANTHKMHLRRQARAHVSQGSVHIFGEENIYLDTRVDLLRSLHIWWRVQTWARQGVHTRSIWGKAERERDREADGDCSTISISQKDCPTLTLKSFFFKENSKEEILDILCFCFSRFWLRLKTNGVVGQIAWTSWSSVDGVSDILRSSFSPVICIFFLPIALICVLNKLQKTAELVKRYIPNKIA